MEKEYRTTFTPEGEPEIPKKCAGKCGKVLPATKFKFKYDHRNGIRGRTRNSSCLRCQYSEAKSRETLFQTGTTERLEILEENVERLNNTVDELVETLESLQLMLMKLSGTVEKLKTNGINNNNGLKKKQ